MASRKDRELYQKEWLAAAIPMTAEGVAAWERKLTRLKQILPGLIEETARTAAYGDRSENAEYVEAKKLMRRTQWQILTLEDKLKRVQVIPSGPNANGTIQLGSEVILESGTTKKTYHIVGPEEAEPAKGRISHLSPLGAALIGKKVDEKIFLSTPSGEKEYIARKIS